MRLVGLERKWKDAQQARQRANMCRYLIEYVILTKPPYNFATALVQSLISY